MTEKPVASKNILPNKASEELILRLRTYSSLKPNLGWLLIINSLKCYCTLGVNFILSHVKCPYFPSLPTICSSFKIDECQSLHRDKLKIWYSYFDICLRAISPVWPFTPENLTFEKLLKRFVKRRSGVLLDSGSRFNYLLSSSLPVCFIFQFPHTASPL